MLCDIPFDAEKKSGYNNEWKVVYSEGWGESHHRWKEVYNKFYVFLTSEMDTIWHKEKMVSFPQFTLLISHFWTEEDKNLRDKIMTYLDDKVNCVYPDGHLLCGGSSISTCGSLTSDMDLCFALKTSDKTVTKFALPIEKYSEEINTFMIDRLNMTLRSINEIKEIDSIMAKVPIVKFKLNAKDVDTKEQDKLFDLDINCNCVAGIYNSYLLGGLANFDERLPKLAIILKRWAKNVKLVDNQSRFNSYLIVLLIVHYLQCGVEPPVLPNLMKLCPEDYDGNKEPWNLTTKVDRKKLPESKNTMNVGALLCSFFRYYSKFDFVKYGILIKDASIIKLADHGRFWGSFGSRIFVEEPYDGLTVPKNIKRSEDFEHIMNEIKIANHLMHPRNEKGKLLSPSLGPLLSRQVNLDTKQSDVDAIFKT